MPASVGEVPEHAHVRVAGAAVVEHDRGVGEQDADEEVPHHPAGRREPEDAVARLRVEVQVQLLQLLEQDPAVALDDRLRQPGGPGGVEDPERMVEGHPLEAELGAGAGLLDLVPAQAAGEPRGVGARGRGRGPARCARRWASSARARRRRSIRSNGRAVVAVAVDREQHLGLDLGEAVDHGRDAEVGRARRPDRADRGRGEEPDQRRGQVRHVGDDAVAAARPRARAGRRRRRATRSRSSPQAISPSCRPPPGGGSRARRPPRSRKMCSA